MFLNSIIKISIVLIFSYLWCKFEIILYYFLIIVKFLQKSSSIADSVDFIENLSDFPYKMTQSRGS